MSSNIFLNWMTEMSTWLLSDGSKGRYRLLSGVFKFQHKIINWMIKSHYDNLYTHFGTGGYLQRCLNLGIIQLCSPTIHCQNE